MKNENAGVDLPAFIFAAAATPIVLFGTSAGVFSAFPEHSGSVYREIAGLVMTGVVFGLPFYAALGLPLAWFVLRGRASRRNPTLFLAALAAAFAGYVLSLLLIGALCVLPTGDFPCVMLPIYVYFGLPGALVFSLAFGLHFIGFRALRRSAGRRRGRD